MLNSVATFILSFKAIRHPMDGSFEISYILGIGPKHLVF